MDTTVYEISLGSGRRDLHPKKHGWEWSEIEDRLRNVVVCAHTMDEYEVMSKAKRTDVKDVGFFIGGEVNRRKVSYRRILSLDIDYPEEGTLDNVRKWLKGHTYIIHSTHSSTDMNPRYRIVAPLDRIVMAEEYGAVMRVLHDTLSVPLDTSTFDFNRIMFLPSIPKDATYFFESQHGDPLCVTRILDSVPNWRDLSTLSVPKSVQIQKPEDKGGIVGSFCARISIREALSSYLSDVWRSEGGDRYTLIGATTTHGGIIYEDAFLYSNHSSDVHAGHCHNAYDAIRLYKYGGGSKGDAEMVKLCEQLDIRVDSKSKHVSYINTFEDEDAKVILADGLKPDKAGNLLKSIQNAELILTYDPKIKDTFAYDLFSESVVLKRTPYWRSESVVQTLNEDCKNLTSFAGMEDFDESFLLAHFEKSYNMDARTCLSHALNITTHRASFHPVRDYLNSLEWDGVQRLERIFVDCFGVPSSIYSREVGVKFFVGAVRRVFMPASKMDYIPVLVSDEGLGKSRFIRRMAKLWGSDSFYTFNGSKEAYEQLRGVWILEIPELNGVQNRSSNSRKAFVTKGEDRYRSAYLKYTKTYKRQCVFIASSNDVVFLDDPNEDGRRWWGLMCNRDAVRIDVHSDAFLELVDQYWAEAVYWFRQGVIPMLSEKAELEARRMRKVHKAESVEEGALIDYLNMPVPNSWYRNTSYVERKLYWEQGRDGWSGEPRSTVCTAEVAREFYGLERGEVTPAKGRQVGDAIRRTGLFTQNGNKKRFGEYGNALAWERIYKQENEIENGEENNEADDGQVGEPEKPKPKRAGKKGSIA